MPDIPAASCLEGNWVKKKNQTWRIYISSHPKIGWRLAGSPHTNYIRKEKMAESGEFSFY